MRVKRDLLRWDLHLDFLINWDLKTRFFLIPDRPTPCMIKGRRWMRAIRINDELVPIILDVKGDLGRERFEITVPEEFGDRKEQVERTVLDLLGLQDIRNLYDFMDKDDILRRIKEKLYGFGRAGLMSATVFEGIVKAIIQQQISLKVAESITANLVEMHL